MTTPTPQTVEQMILQEMREHRRDLRDLRDSVADTRERMARIDPAVIDTIARDVAELRRLREDHGDLTGRVDIVSERVKSLEVDRTERDGAVKAGKATIAGLKLVGGVIVGTGIGAGIWGALTAILGG